MGRYRRLLGAIVRHTNIISRAVASLRLKIDTDIELSITEWQILEYIYEHEKDDMRMIYLSDSLGIPQSSFSKYVKKLENHGLVERFQAPGNRKNVIIKPSPKGRHLYKSNTEGPEQEMWRRFFASLDGVPDEYLEQFTKALEDLNDFLMESE